MSKETIVGGNPHAKYFAQIPIIAQRELNPYELSLYTNYVQTCGSHNGETTKSHDTLSKETKMSVAKIKNSRQSLFELGYINLMNSGRGKIARVSLRDIWEINTRYARSKSIDEKVALRKLLKGSSEEATSKLSESYVRPKDSSEEAINNKEKKKEKKTARKRANASTIPATLMNPMKDSIADAFGWSFSTMTGNEKGMVQRTAKQLCEANVQPSDVSGLYGYVKAMGVNFNPTALANHVSNWRGTKPKTREVVTPAEPLPVTIEPTGEYEPTQAELFWVNTTATFGEQIQMRKTGQTLKDLRSQRDATLDNPVSYTEQRELIERDITIEELRGER